MVICQVNVSLLSASRIGGTKKRLMHANLLLDLSFCFGCWALYGCIYISNCLGHKNLLPNRDRVHIEVRASVCFEQRLVGVV